MDLLAALALMLVLEGLSLAMFSRSLPQILGELDRLDPDTLRRVGIAAMVLGIGAYLAVRGVS
ncbi:MAG: DUF2065 family protein [Pseudomonadota bacterium]